MLYGGLPMKRLGRFFILLITILFPAIPFFIQGRILYGIGALFLQATVVGWIPAIAWSRNTWNKDMEKERALKEGKESELEGQS